MSASPCRTMRSMEGEARFPNCSSPSIIPWTTPTARRLSMVLLLALLALAVPMTVLGDVTVGPGGGTPGTASNFTLVGHNDLFARGMNAAIANFDHYVYVGNRTDGSSRCGFGDPRRTDPNFGLDSCPHVHPGILILNIEEPTKPTFVGEIPAPLDTDSRPAIRVALKPVKWRLKKSAHAVVAESGEGI